MYSGGLVFDQSRIVAWLCFSISHCLRQWSWMPIYCHTQCITSSLYFCSMQQVLGQRFDTSTRSLDLSDMFHDQSEDERPIIMCYLLLPHLRAGAYNLLISYHSQKWIVFLCPTLIKSVQTLQLSLTTLLCIATSCCGPSYCWNVPIVLL